MQLNPNLQYLVLVSSWVSPKQVASHSTFWDDVKKPFTLFSLSWLVCPVDLIPVTLEYGINWRCETAVLLTMLT